MKRDQVCCVPRHSKGDQVGCQYQASGFLTRMISSKIINERGLGGNKSSNGVWVGGGVSKFG